MKKNTQHAKPKLQFKIRVVALFSDDLYRKLAVLSNRSGMSAAAVLRQLVSDAK